MRKINCSFLVLFSIVLLFMTAGCQGGNLNPNTEVTEIEVVNWETEEHVAVIQDEQFIPEIVEKLENAETHSTASMDFAMPDYKLLFKNEEEVLYEIGYYIEMMKLGIEGRYWEFDKIYGVTQELPLPAD